MIIQELTEYVNYEVLPDNYTCLLYAAFKGNIQIIEMLIKQVANIYHKNKFGLGVLHVAAQGD